MAVPQRRAMAKLVQTIPLKPSGRDVANLFDNTPVRLFQRRVACSSGNQRTRWRLSCGISNMIPTSKATGRRDRIRVIARANEVPRGDLQTGNGLDSCEIVRGSDITLGEGEGTFQAYLVRAIKNDTGVAVLFLTDVLGVHNGDSRDFAHRLACVGYNVLVPDLFRGVPWSSERPEDEYESWRELHSPHRVAKDIDVATKYLVQHFGPTGKLGVIGFCFGGGRLIETLARDSNELFATGAFVYGTRFEISLTKQIRVPLLLIAGDSDDLCSPAIICEVKQTVPRSKAKIYSGFGHAFAHHPSSPEQREAAEDAFSEIMRWFQDHLSTRPALTV